MKAKISYFEKSILMELHLNFELSEEDLQLLHKVVGVNEVRDTRRYNKTLVRGALFNHKEVIDSLKSTFPNWEITIEMF